jgi:hypothetical protein
VVFFYEIFFVVLAVVAVLIGEAFSRTLALAFLIVWWAIVMLGYASFGARLAASGGLTDEDQRWFHDARDGLRHLRLLLGLACAAALVWRVLAG